MLTRTALYVFLVSSIASVSMSNATSCPGRIGRQLETYWVTQGLDPMRQFSNHGDTRGIQYIFTADPKHSQAFKLPVNREGPFWLMCMYSSIGGDDETAKNNDQPFKSVRLPALTITCHPTGIGGLACLPH